MTRRAAIPLDKQGKSVPSAARPTDYVHDGLQQLASDEQTERESEIRALTQTADPVGRVFKRVCRCNG